MPRKKIILDFESNEIPVEQFNDESQKPTKQRKQRKPRKSQIAVNVDGDGDCLEEKSTDELENAIRQLENHHNECTNVLNQLKNKRKSVN